MKITIHSQTPSQKNSKQIFYNKSTGKPFITSSKIVKEWQNFAAVELLKYRIKEPLEGRQELSIMFYVKDNRRRDLENMASTIQDALVSAQILVDDDWQHLRIASLDAQIDKLDPRAEIDLKSV